MKGSKLELSLICKSLPFSPPLSSYTCSCPSPFLAFFSIEVLQAFAVLFSQLWQRFIKGLFVFIVLWIAVKLYWSICEWVAVCGFCFFCFFNCCRWSSPDRNFWAVDQAGDGVFVNKSEFIWALLTPLRLPITHALYSFSVLSFAPIQSIDSLQAPSQNGFVTPT